MSQCPYRIKDAKGIGWFVCQREEGHPDDGPGGGHRPALPVLSRGDRSALLFEGIWHRPEVDPQPYCVCDEVRKFIAKKITTDRWWTCEVHGNQHFDPDAPNPAVLSVWEKP